MVPSRRSNVVRPHIYGRGQLTQVQSPSEYINPPGRNHRWPRGSGGQWCGRKMGGGMPDRPNYAPRLMGQLHEALMSAFPDWVAMELLVDLNFEKPLREYARREPHSATVLDVIGWMRSEGMLTDLVRLAFEEKTRNPLLREVAPLFLDDAATGGTGTPDQRAVVPVVAEPSAPVLQPPPGQRLAERPGG